MSVTIADLCEKIPVLDPDSGKFQVSKVRHGKEVSHVADGLKPKKPPAKEGLHHFTPEELLTLHVPVITTNGAVRGYQRPFYRGHARNMAVSQLNGDPMPKMHISIDGHGTMFTTDGQHRAVSGVITGLGADGIVEKMSKDQQRRLFANQRKAKPVDRNVLVLAGDGPYESYIKKACGDESHPWGKIVSPNPSSKVRITPFAMQGLLLMYVSNTRGARSPSAVHEERWDERLADELAPLVACFGNKRDNPLAFQQSALMAIGETAMHVFRRNENVQKDDYKRWLTHQAKFPWDDFPWIRKQAEFTNRLVLHWNKRLHASRKVYL